MGKWSRLLTLVSLSVLAQACNSTGVADTNKPTLAEAENTLKEKFTPATTIQVPKEQMDSVVEYGKIAIADECERQSWIPWCEEGMRQTVGLKPLSVLKASEISHSVQRGYSYVADVEDSWNSYSALHLKKEMWYGDCDDLTSTTLDMLHRQGQPLDKMWMLLNNVRSRRSLDHIVGVIQAADGKFYIVGDTDARSMYPLEQMTFSPRALARMDNPTVWVPATQHPMFKNQPKLLGKKLPMKATMKKGKRKSSKRR